jgi:hypothetical protein
MRRGADGKWNSLAASACNEFRPGWPGQHPSGTVLKQEYSGFLPSEIAVLQPAVQPAVRTAVTCTQRTSDENRSAISFSESDTPVAGLWPSVPSPGILRHAKTSVLSSKRQQKHLKRVNYFRPNIVTKHSAMLNLC